MNVNEKNKIIREAQQQTAALKKISRWKMIAMAVSTLGVALAYAGFAGFIHILAIDDFSVFGYKIAATTRAFPKRIAIGFQAINIIAFIAA